MKGRKKARAAKHSPIDDTDREGQAEGERESTLSVKTPKISSEIGPSRARHSAPHGEKQEGAWSLVVSEPSCMNAAYST